MKKILLILLAALALGGCGKKEDSLAFPKVEYAKEPIVTLPPKPTPTPDELVYGLDVLPVMENGYAADLVASYGNNLLVADSDSEDYQLLWLQLERDEKGTPQVKKKKILKQSEEQREPEEKYIRALCSDWRKGYFYVLYGEAVPYSAAFPETGDPVITRNEDYQGRYRIETYNSNGDLLKSISISDLPVDCVRNILSLNDDRLFILGGMQQKENGENWFAAAVEKDVFLTVYPSTGDVLTKAVCDDASIYSISSRRGDKLMAFINDEKYPGFYLVDAESGKKELQPIAWDHGLLGLPWCIQSQSDLFRLNTQESFCEYEPADEVLIANFDSAMDYTSPAATERINGLDIQLNSVCDMGSHIFLSLRGSPELLVIGPK